MFCSASMSEPMTTTTNSVPKAALITGGSRGIGAACARLFARQGYGVGIVCQKAKDRAEALAEELAGLGVPVKVYVCDVAQREQVQAILGGVEQTRTYLGRIRAEVQTPLKYKTKKNDKTCRIVEN